MVSRMIIEDVVYHLDTSEVREALQLWCTKQNINASVNNITWDDHGAYVKAAHNEREEPHLSVPASMKDQAQEEE